MVTRYQEKYVSPAIKQQLTAYFPDNEIQSHSVDNFLVTEANDQLDSDISKLIMEYNKVPANQYGDKYQQLNNIFRSIEKNRHHYAVKSQNEFNGICETGKL